MRAKIFNAITVIVFIFLAGGLLNSQIIHGTDYKELSRKNCIRLLPQMGSRGKILDRQGNVIVTSRLSYDAEIMPQEVLELDTTLADVSKILGTGSRELMSRFRANLVSSSLPVTVAKNIELKSAVALEESKFDLNGVVVSPHPLRDYPNGKTASHILGYLNKIDHWRLTKLEDYGYKTKDIVGFGGVEEKYDYYLRQDDGGTSVEVDRKGRFARVVGFEPPKSGKDIQLTLDLRIQKIVEGSLSDRKAGVVVMDPSTGEIIALASSPDFDPDIFVKQDNAAISGVFNNPGAPLFDRAISGVYPPGSVFKLVVAAAALETGKITPDTTFTCNGEIRVGNQRFGCWSTHNEQNLTDAIAHSCDVFFYRTGLLLGPQLISEYSEKFGLGKLTEIDLPYESQGLVPNPLWKKIRKFKNWYDGDTANFSIGQGDLLTTPLQIARMVAVFANGGKLLKPYIVKSVQGENIAEYQKKAETLGLKESTIRSIAEGMREVVASPKGTANVLSGLAVTVAGKTGTAQAAGGQSHAWFAGFFPYENPRFVICVCLERGGPGYNACVVAKQIIEEMIKEGLI
ncbi:MAG: penicillin-binding protein 2 [Candidatus Omnitrophica bacterium]|nr:penicillin-binding protein 2 [Candidatus Omnitrophota bacterium]